MEVGQTKTFKYRERDGSIQEAIGTIQSVDRITSDGIRVIEVEFADTVRSYSAQHI